MAAITRTATGTWRGSLKEGDGTMDAPSGVLAGTRYSFATRFGDAKGTNPEELIGAAHAACFSMAFSMILGQHDLTPDAIDTKADVSLEKSGDGFAITRIHLHTKAKIPGADEATFQKAAQAAKEGCPVSKALTGVPEITLEAELIT